MSLGYADRLKHYPNKGVCGLPEKHDSARRLQNSLEKIVALVREAEHLVVFTGAGISTSAGIPDFRGPNGIWTKQQREDKSVKEEKKRARAQAAASRGPAQTGRQHAAAPERPRAIVGDPPRDPQLQQPLRRTHGHV